MKTIKTISIPAGQAASVCTACPDENLSNNKGLIVSLDDWYDCSRNECRTLLQFAAKGVLPERARLVKAEICLSPVRGSLKSICAFKNLSGFDQCTVTWCTRPKTEKAPFAWACVDSFIEIDVTSVLKRSGGFLGVTLVAETVGNLLLISCGEDGPCLRISYIEGDCPPPPPPPPSKANVENIFDQQVYTFDAQTEEVRYSSVFDAAHAERVTFFVKNTGSNPFVFNIQISPDGVDFIDDAQIFTVSPGELRAFTPYLFARYMRAKIAAGPVSSSATVWIQTQTRNYLIK